MSREINRRTREMNKRINLGSKISYNDRISRLAGMLLGAYPSLPYHNFSHAVDVWSVVRNYAEHYMLSNEERLILESAALLHDVVYVINAKDNEEKSALFASRELPALGYSGAQIKSISALILATKWPTNPRSFLEEIICDADLDNLGRDDFFEKSGRLLKEWNVSEDIEWYKKQVALLENNHYYTSIAKKTRDEGKRKNIDALRKIIADTQSGIREHSYSKCGNGGGKC